MFYKQWMNNKKLEIVSNFFKKFVDQKWYYGKQNKCNYYSNFYKFTNYLNTKYNIKIMWKWKCEK
jgi:hypothetical protein